MSASEDGSHKTLLARPRRFVRLLWSVIDPRAWAHLIKIVNYYNYTHVQPMRKLTLGPFEDTGGIAPNVSFTNPERNEIGARAAIVANCHLWAGNGTARIVIGDDLLMAPDVLLVASTYRINAGQPVTKQPMDEADIVIGDDGQADAFTNGDIAFLQERAIHPMAWSPLAGGGLFSNAPIMAALATAGAAQGAEETAMALAWH